MDQWIIEKLRARIPEVNCEEGCCDCCKLFLWSEWKEVESHNTSLAQEVRCERLINERCSIYDERPIICRIFGASEDPAFYCPRGRMADKPLSAEETKEIIVQWLSLLSDQEVG